MTPDLTLSTIISEGASTGCESMVADVFSTKPQNHSLSLSSRASFYLHRVPSGSRQWQMYLKDLVASKIKRSQRVQRESESINDFLNRFPIYEKH